MLFRSKWTRCMNNFERTGACEDTRGCQLVMDYMSTMDNECVPAPVEPAEEKGKTMGFGGSITPHDINRLVQYTLYARHFDGNYSADDQSGRHMDITENYRKDGFVNFTEYESFMEAMLVLFGNDTSPPDIDKIFEAYGVAPKYKFVDLHASARGGNSSTMPGPEGTMISADSFNKVISIDAVPISQYWFRKIFGNGPAPPAPSLYERDGPGQGMAKEWYKSEVLRSSGFFGQSPPSYGTGEGATLNDTVRSLFVDCGAPASALGRGAPASARGSGSGSGSSSGASSCFDLPLLDRKSVV